MLSRRREQRRFHPAWKRRGCRCHPTWNPQQNVDATPPCTPTKYRCHPTWKPPRQPQKNMERDKLCTPPSRARDYNLRATGGAQFVPLVFVKGTRKRQFNILYILLHLELNIWIVRFLMWGACLRFCRRGLRPRLFDMRGLLGLD